MQTEPKTDTAPLSMRRNFGWNLAGNVIYAACQWGMLVVVAKAGSVDLVGRFILGLAVAAPVILFGNLQLRIIQATDAENKRTFADYYNLRLLTNAAALAVIIGIALFARVPAESRAVIIAIGIAKAIEAISDIIFGLFQKMEMMDRVARSMIVKGIASLGAFAAVMYATGSLLAAVASLAAVRLLVLVFYDMRNARAVSMESHEVLGRLVVRLDLMRDARRTLLNLAFTALPLGAAALLTSLFANIPRYFVQHFHGESLLGYFAAIAYVIVAGNILANALAQASSARLGKYFAADPSAFCRLLAKLLFFSVVLGTAGVLAVALFGREILTILYQSDYAEHNEVFVWIMGAAALLYPMWFLNYAMTAAGRLKVQTVLSIAAVLAVAAGCLLLVPERGIVGAAIAMFFANGVRLAGSLAVNVLFITARFRAQSKTVGA